MQDTSGAIRVHRVTVRGRFRDLTEAARASLVAAQAEHDIFHSAFSEEGTFTYDSRIDFFNLRYEIRLRGDGDATEAQRKAVEEARVFLRILGIGHGPLRAASMDMTAMWDKAR